MFDLFLREIKEKLLGSLLSLTPKDVTPNQITVSSLFFGLASGYFCAVGNY